jgi:hypothetical protein
MPWQNTMLGLLPVILLSFLYGCGEVNSFISRPLCAITPAATVLPVVKRNWRRFGRGDPAERFVMFNCGLPHLKARKRRAVQPSPAPKISLSV